MGLDLGGFLSVYATLMDGDPLSLDWSIGGPVDGLLGTFAYVASFDAYF